MKKSTKLVCVALCAAFAAVMFCGCKELDEIRAQRGVWKNAEHTAFVLGGKTYKKLKNTKNISFSFLTDEGVITEEDVPVLLADLFGSRMYANYNGEAAQVSWDTYVRTDVYDEYKELLSSANPYTDYAVTLYDVKKDTQIPMIFEKEETQLLEAAMQRATKRDVGVQEIKHTVYIEKSDKNFRVSEYCLTLIEEYEGDIIFEYENGDIYKASKEDYAALKELITKYAQ